MTHNGSEYIPPDGVTQVVQGSTTAIFATIYSQIITESVMWFVIAGLMTIADLYFGISAALYRGEVIKLSTAIRKTLDKIFAYICWVVLSVSLSIGFEMPWLKFVIFAIIYGAELSSCISNYFAAHGKKININIFSILGKKMGVEELTDVKIEDCKDSKE